MCAGISKFELRVWVNIVSLFYVEIPYHHIKLIIRFQFVCNILQILRHLLWYKYFSTFAASVNIVLGQISW